MVLSWKVGRAIATAAGGSTSHPYARAMPVGHILKLNLYAIGIEDEQFGRIAAPRYLGTGAAG